MSARLERFVADACRGGLLLARSRQSYEQLRGLGLNARLGADTAWTYEPSLDARRAAHVQLAAGRTSGQALAVVCPMNPFCWPIRVDFAMARELAESGRHAELHYDSVLFHSAPEGADAAYRRYLDALVETVRAMTARGFFPVIVGMEKLDARACADLDALLPHRLPRYVSGSAPAEAIVAVLQSAELVVTSRFHAAVLSLAAGVRTVGIALDERIRNLYSENGLERWFLRCDDPELGARLVEAVAALPQIDPEPQYADLVRRQIEGIGSMGLRLHDEVVRLCEGFPPAPLPRTGRAFLPPVSARLAALLDGGTRLRHADLP